MSDKLDREAIRCCRTIGRDEVERVMRIGLAEMDALCDTAEAGLQYKQVVVELMAHLQKKFTAATTLFVDARKRRDYRYERMWADQAHTFGNLIAYLEGMVRVAERGDMNKLRECGPTQDSLVLLEAANQQLRELLLTREES